MLGGNGVGVAVGTGALERAVRGGNAPAASSPIRRAAFCRARTRLCGRSLSRLARQSPVVCGSIDFQRKRSLHASKVRCTGGERSLSARSQHSRGDDAPQTREGLARRGGIDCRSQRPPLGEPNSQFDAGEACSGGARGRVMQTTSVPRQVARHASSVGLGVERGELYNRPITLSAPGPQLLPSFAPQLPWLSRTPDRYAFHASPTCFLFKILLTAVSALCHCSRAATHCRYFVVERSAGAVAARAAQCTGSVQRAACVRNHTSP